MEQDKSKLKAGIYQTMLSMRRRGGIATKLYWLMEDMGIRITLSRFFNWKNGWYLAKNPSDEMKEAQRYFIDHKDEIKQVLNILADEESKQTYIKILKYRQTMKHKDLPINAYRTQYFGNDFFEYGMGEVFIDCGAFDGDSVRKFKKLMKRNGITEYKCVCFEPDDENYKALTVNHSDAICYRSGVYSNNGQLLFRIGHGDDNNIIDEADKEHYSDNEITTISVLSIDETESCYNATYIKMDIEGSERMAIKGAQKTILRNKPKLAISIYHSNEDMVKIPLMIHELVPEYKLYVKHHSNGVPETVLYATI